MMLIAIILSMPMLAPRHRAEPLFFFFDYADHDADAATLLRGFA